MSVELAASGNFPPKSRALVATAILCLVMVCAYLDRSVLAILVEPIRATLKMTDTQLGLLQGIAFILAYAIMGVPMGRLVDRHVRKNFLCAGVMMWSVMTIACGFAENFWSLFFARAGVGIGEAILAPATFSMLADLYAPLHRGKAIAAVALCGTVGAGLSYLAGGAVFEFVPGHSQVSLPIIGGVWGWQLVFFVVGCPGILIGLITLAMREPVRQEVGIVTQVQGPGFLSYARAAPRTFFSVYLACAILAGISYALGAWMAAHFIRKFGIAPAHVGYVLGILTIVAGVVGGLGGGILSDVLTRRNAAGRLQVLAICSGVGVIFLAAWPMIAEPTWAFLALFLAVVSVSIGTSTASVMIQDVVPNRLRGEALGFYFFIQGIIGPGLGPLSVALVSDYVISGPNHLPLAIVGVTVPAVILVGLLATWGCGSYARTRRKVVAPDDAQPAS
jgi:MFS family permease